MLFTLLLSWLKEKEPEPITLLTLWLSWPAEHELQVDHTAHVLVLLAKGTGATVDLIVLQVYPVMREAGAMTNSVPELLLREQFQLESWILISLTAWRHWNT
jgi:hypothetical protein